MNLFQIKKNIITKVNCVYIDMSLEVVAQICISSPMWTQQYSFISSLPISLLATLTRLLNWCRNHLDFIQYQYKCNLFGSLIFAQAGASKMKENAIFFPKSFKCDKQHPRGRVLECIWNAWLPYLICCEVQPTDFPLAFWLKLLQFHPFFYEPTNKCRKGKWLTIIAQQSWIGYKLLTCLN